MLKQAKSPDGYKHLLVYRKAEELAAETLSYTATFPRDKTGVGLADQMDRSVRSVKQNIVEGWKRNATHEYYQFLGYAIASNAELQEDFADICLGRYEEKGIKGGNGQEKGKGAEEKGERGEGGEMGERGEREKKEWLESLRFYPLDTRLPRPVQGYLRCKELNMLLEKLQASLLERMKTTGTLSERDRVRLTNEKIRKKEEEAEAWMKEQFRVGDLVLTGQGVKKREEAKRLGLVFWEYGEPEK
ncbi:MAG: four helix bundle protein [Patescibacteria group bacterium]